MIKEIFTVHDNKGQLFSPPQFYRNKADALRAWETICKDPESQYSKYPDDYDFCHLGYWNEETCEFGDLDVNILSRATDFQS